jgi:hypothetical protein
VKSLNEGKASVTFRSALAGAFVLVLLLGLANGASAAGVVGADRFADFTDATSSDKTVTINCPAGMKVLSPGMFLQVGGFNQVLLDEFRPNAGLASATINAIEDETGTAENWTLSYGAMCAAPPPGLERVSATSATSSANKAVSVSCPAGKRVLGAGADINSANGQVILDGLQPNAALTAVTVNALEDETGNSGNWSVTAYAVCANALAGLERIAQTSPVDSSQSKFLEPVCPGGKAMTGYGADINSPNGQVLLDVLDMRGGTGSAGAGVEAIEDDTGNAANWSVTAYVICVPGLRREFVTSPADSSPKNVNVTCANPGMLVTGLGAAVLGTTPEVLLERFRPNPANNALSTAFEDDGGFAGNWRLTGNAVCSTPLPGQVIASNVTRQTTGSSKTLTVTCPAGKRVVGAAGEIFNGLGQVVLEDVRPSADLTSATVFAHTDETGTFNSWSLTARAICANPPPGLQLVSSTSLLDSGSTKGATAVCPAPKNALSEAFEINSPNGQVQLRNLNVDNLLTAATANGIEDVTGNASNWSITAYAICASP